MANEFDAIIARLGEHNVSDKECLELAAQAAMFAVSTGSIEAGALAAVLNMAYKKMGNKDIVYDQPTELKTEVRTPKTAIGEARAAIAKKNELTGGAKKGSVAERLKKVISKPAEEKAADKAAEKAAKAAAKEAKKKKKAKVNPNEVVKAEKKVVTKSAENDKKLDKLKEKEEKKKKKDKEPKTAAEKEKQMQEKIAKLSTKGLDIKEQGASWMMKVQDAKGQTVLVNVTSEVNKLQSLNSKIDDANRMIEQQNQSVGKPNIAIDPKSAAKGKDITAADGVPVVNPEMTDAVKKEAFMAQLSSAEFKTVDGNAIKLSDKDIKFLAETALERLRDEEILRKLREKEKEESKREHGPAPKSLATPTKVVSR